MPGGGITTSGFGGPGGGAPVLISKTWYYYNLFGNVVSVVARLENPGPGETKVTATSMGYAKNGSAVTFVFGETWNESGSGAPINYDITYAREFRYAGARQRYLSRELDPDGLELNGQVQNPVILTSLSETWTDYDGNQPYGDFSYDSGSLQHTRSYELGIGTFGWTGGNPDSTTLSFYHGDMIGTTRLTTDSAGTLADSAVYTAFGERVSGSANRFGYAGAHGYQTDDTGNFPFQHLGARYYDPSIGRFLQRDPIGINAGTNVYVYVLNQPTVGVDPEGEFILIAIVSGIAVGVKIVTAYHNYRAAQDEIYAALPYDDGSNESTQRRLRSREDALRRSAKNIQGVMSCYPGTSITGPPTPSQNATEGTMEVIGGIVGGS